jgi:hypothetical protein
VLGRIVHCTRWTQCALEEELRPCIPNISGTSYIKITSDVKILKWLTPEWVWCDQTHTILHEKHNDQNNIGYDIVYDIGYDINNIGYDIRYDIEITFGFLFLKR